MLKFKIFNLATARSRNEVSFGLSTFFPFECFSFELVLSYGIKQREHSANKQANENEHKKYYKNYSFNTWNRSETSKIESTIRPRRVA